MFWLKFVSDFFKVLRAGQTPAQIAGGFALGSMTGLVPTLTLQTLVIWLVVFILNVNLSAAFFAFTLFSMISYLLDPIFHWLGYQLLVEVAGLKGLWTTLYNAPIAPLTRFNNTVVLGSFVCSLVFFAPMFFGMKKFVVAYRTHVHSAMESWRLYQIISKSALVRWYFKIRDLGG